MKIAIDLDDVLNNLVESWLSWYNEYYEKQVRVSDIKSWQIANYTSPEIYHFLDKPEAFYHLEPKEGAIEVVSYLNSLADLYIVTAFASRPTIIRDKWRWIGKFLPWFNTDRIIFAQDKSIIRANFLIDDGPHNLSGFSGTGIVFDQPWNRNCDEISHLPRVHDWSEVLDFLGFYLKDK